MESLSAFNLTDDFEIDAEIIKDKINDVRSVLIAEEWKAKMLDDQYYQKVCCLEIKCEDVACNVAGVPMKAGQKQYYVELPALNNRIDWDNIKYLGTIDMANNFNRLTLSGMLSSDGNRWTAKDTFYTVINDRAILKNLPTANTRFLCLVGILDRPNQSCDWLNDDTDYPCSNVLKLEMLVKQDILSAYGLPKDKLQDSQEAVPGSATPNVVPKVPKSE